MHKKFDVKTFKKSDIILNEQYNFLIPVSKKSNNSVVPDYVLNTKGELLLGYFELENLSDNEEIEALVVNKSNLEALFFVYNYALKQRGIINLYEKLKFLYKAYNFGALREDLLKLNLQININEELKKNLEQLLSDDFKNILINDRVSLKTALKLLTFERADRLILIRLFCSCSFSFSNQLELTEISRELRFREKKSLEKIFNDLNIFDYLAEQKPQEKITKALKQFRYPNFMAMQEKWNEEIKSLSLDKNIKINHTPFFEKREVELKIKFKDINQCKDFLKRALNKKNI